MSRLLDISRPLRPGMTCWPGSPGLRLERTLSLDAGDPVNNSRLDCDVHVGTHVDAPLHHLAGGPDAASLPIEALVGTALVVHFPGLEAISAAALESAAVPAGTDRLLLRTRNSAVAVAAAAPFSQDFCALTADAARWVVARGIRLLGVDGPSVQRFHDGPETHRTLLRAGVVVLEGLDLSGVEPGGYELLCLPLGLVGSDGAPARAVLRRLAP